MANKLAHFNHAKWLTESPWLHYNEQNDSVLCFICAQQHEKFNLHTSNKSIPLSQTASLNGKKLWRDLKNIRSLMS